MQEIEAISLHPKLIGISLPDAPLPAEVAAQARRHNAFDIFTGASWPVAPQASR